MTVWGDGEVWCELELSPTRIPLESLTRFVGDFFNFWMLRGVAEFSESQPTRIETTPGSGEDRTGHVAGTRTRKSYFFLSFFLWVTTLWAGKARRRNN